MRILFGLVLVISIAGMVGCAARDMELSNEGFKEISRKDYGQAEKNLEEALSINPYNPYALLNMGVVYQETGRLDEARRMYRTLIASHPKDIAEESNKDSSAGKGLAEIARENLELLEAREVELAAGRKPHEAASQATPTSPGAKEDAKPLPETKGSAPLAAAAPSPAESKMPAEEIFYEVGKNESLLDIARRQEIYNDALKWPSLLRFNLSEMEKMKMTERLPVEKLPEGLRLKYVSRDEASQNLKTMADRLWVVEIASSKSMNGVVPYAILLIRKGYHAYLTKSQLAGEEWIRLRVGFYKDILESLKVSDEVKVLLNTSETPMPMKIDREELEQYSGY